MKAKRFSIFEPQEADRTFWHSPNRHVFFQKLYPLTRPLTFFHTKFFISRVSLQLLKVFHSKIQKKDFEGFLSQILFIIFLSYLKS